MRMPRQIPRLRPRMALRRADTIDEAGAAREQTSAIPKAPPPITVTPFGHAKINGSRRIGGK